MKGLLTLSNVLIKTHRGSNFIINVDEILCVEYVFEPEEIYTINITFINNFSINIMFKNKINLEQAMLAILEKRNYKES